MPFRYPIIFFPFYSSYLPSQHRFPLLLSPFPSSLSRLSILSLSFPFPVFSSSSLSCLPPQRPFQTLSLPPPSSQQSVDLKATQQPGDGCRKLPDQVASTSLEARPTGGKMGEGSRGRQRDPCVDGKEEEEEGERVFCTSFSFRIHGFLQVAITYKFLPSFPRRVPSP